MTLAKGLGRACRKVWGFWPRAGIRLSWTAFCCPWADEALEALRFFPNKSARLLEAVLKSALGNAEDRGARDIDDLVVSESRVDGGPMMKRIQPRARGSAYTIKRRYSHIHITLSDWEE